MTEHINEAKNDFIITSKEADYSSGYYVEGDDDDPYSSGSIAGVGKIKTLIEGNLADRVLARVGSTDGLVEIIEDHWDIGYCVTCSDEMIDFEILVDGKKVFRSRYWGSGEYDYDESNLNAFVNSYTAFQTWLDGGEVGGYDEGAG